MNSYLDLIKEYNRVHYKKNRITILCIVIAVSLVNTIFGMADMGVRSQIQAEIKQQGNFHIALKNVDETTANHVGSRSDVNVAGWVHITYSGTIQDKTLAIMGGEETITKQMNLFAEQGRFPNSPNEAMLDQQAMEQFSIALNQMVSVNLADGSKKEYKIVGAYGDFSNLKAYDSHGLYLCEEGIKAIGTQEDRSYYYVQFKKHANIREAIANIKESLQLTDKQVIEHVALLGLMGQSEDNFMIQLYMTAAVLFVLVLIAGVVMIAGNFNMSVMQRIQFFGLLRCLGASKAQVKRFVLLEGIHISLKAIPIGLLIGTAVVWGLSAFLKYYNATYFGDMPLFQLSGAAIVVGALVGFLTVILASLSPCKKASMVSPLSAINGNVNTANVPQAKKAMGLKNMKVETAIGISHCFANKKNMLLMSASFAISIILFLAFSVMVTFMYQALKPLKPYSPDVSIAAQEGTTINRQLLEQINKISDIKRVYGRMFAYDVPVITRYGNEKMMLISYEQNQFNWAKQMLAKGKLDEVENGDGVLVVYNEDLKWELEDKIKLEETGKQLNISGILSNCPFDRQPGTQIVICSEKTFENLMQTSGYTIIDMQLDKEATDQTVSSIRALVDSSFNIYDRRQSNIEARTMFYSMAIFIYGFLMVIALITVLNIINNMNSSVAIRLNYYGIMMAVGMSIKQIRKMIVVEAATYAFCGCLLGCVLAIPIHKFLFEALITYKWAIAWTLPIQSLMIIISITIITTLIAVIWPVKKISEMDIVKVVNAA